MTPRTRITLGLALVLALVAPAMWFSGPWRAPQGPSEASPAADGAPQVAEPPPPAAPRTEAAAIAPLPPEDAPLAGVIGPLAARADAGDRKAACRLAMELLRCEQLEDYASILTAPSDPPKDEEGGAARQRSAVRDYMERERTWIVERLEQCEAVPAALVNEGARYLEQAALAGEPEAMVRYAEGHHWPPSGRGAMAGPAFDRWRRNVPGMMQRAVEGGYPGAVFLLMIAYQDDFGFHAALVPNDPYRSMVMNLLHARLYGGQGMTAYLRDMDAASQARATKEAEAMHQQYFQGRKFSGYPYPFPAYVQPMSGQANHDFCRDP